MAGIKWDGDKSHLLKGIGPKYRNPPELIGAYIDAVRTFRSDGDHRRVLESVLDRREMESALSLQVVKSTSGISSDGDKSAVLIKAAPMLPNSEAEQLAFLAAARTI